MSVDYFRRVPRDFTETTSVGTLLSIVATCVMGSLFFLEFREFLTTSVVTDVIMDDAGDSEDIQINFDLTMPDLVCQVCQPFRPSPFPLSRSPTVLSAVRVH